MPIDSIGPRQPGMIPEPEGEQPDLSAGQAVKGAQIPKTSAEAAESFPKQPAKIHEGAIFPKSPEPGGSRLEDAKLQGVLVRDQLQMAGPRMALVQQPLAAKEEAAGAWEAKFQGEGRPAAELGHKAASGIQSQDHLQFARPAETKHEAAMDKDHKHQVEADLRAQGKFQFADEKVSMIGQKLPGEIQEKKWDKDLLVQERLSHSGERVSQLSDKLTGEMLGKIDKDLLVRDKLKLANEGAITLSRSKGQISGSEAGVWADKLQGEGRSAAGIDDVKGHKHTAVSTHKNLGQIGPESSGVLLDKDHKAISVAENLGLAQSQNIWSERSAGDGASQRPGQSEGDIKGIIIDNKPGAAGVAIIDDHKLDVTGKGIIQDGKPIRHK